MKTRLNPRLALAVLLGAAALPVAAGSLAASSAAGGSSASSASSASSDKSSDSSTPAKQAEGAYRIVDVAAVNERPDTLRVTLEPLAANGAGDFILYLPQQAFERSRLAVGGTVTARQRPYGTEFADAGTRVAFFLEVNDDWYRELAAHPVKL